MNFSNEPLQVPVLVGSEGLTIKYGELYHIFLVPNDQQTELFTEKTQPFCRMESLHLDKDSWKEHSLPFGINAEEARLEIAVQKNKGLAVCADCVYQLYDVEEIDAHNELKELMSMLF